MNDALKSFGRFLLGICVLVATMLVLTTFIMGGVWLSDRVYPWLVILTAITLFVLVLVLLPLSIFRRTRALAGFGIFLASYVFGLTLWVWSLLTSYAIWGATGIVIGLMLGGIGVVPIAILATLFHGMWSMVGQLLLVTAMTIGTRLLGIWVMMKSEDDNKTPGQTIQPTTAALQN